jgi:putative FmdB family regulatory protein
MPVYDFKCPKCGLTIEKMQSFYAKAPKCPDCGVDCVRLISTGYFQFSPYLRELGGDNMISY